ncbi:MAG: response regulator [Chromatiales bacterium]|nr:response regulator [Chromatiales bacterium]
MSEVLEKKTVEESSVEKSAIRLLLVDDEPAVLRSLRRLFRSDEYSVQIADSGAAALELLEQTQVDVVVSDMRMPNMTGAELLTQIANRWPETARIVLTGYADLGDAIEAINKGNIYRYISKPWDEDDLRRTVQQAAEQIRLTFENKRLLQLSDRQNMQLKVLNTELEKRVEERTEELRMTAEKLDIAYSDLEASYTKTVEIFARFIEQRTSILSGHGNRVAKLAKALAKRLHLDEREIQDIYTAGLLHDLGKLVLPDSVVERPLSELTEEESRVMKKHPLLGEAALTEIPSLVPCARLIRGHHERYDGKGYPDGLFGDHIPLGARVLAVVEDYDELCMGVVVEHAHTPSEALQYLRAHVETRYDPDVVKAFIVMMEEDVTLSVPPSELCIGTDDLKPGMILTRDLMSVDGMLLLTAGHALAESTIKKIRRLENDDSTSYTYYVSTAG